MGSVVAVQPYLRPSADTPVARKGVYQLLICAPAVLGTRVFERISRGTAAHLLLVRVQGLATERGWPIGLPAQPAPTGCYDHARRAGGRGSFLKSKDRTSGIWPWEVKALSFPERSGGL